MAPRSFTFTGTFTFTYVSKPQGGPGRGGLPPPGYVVGAHVNVNVPVNVNDLALPRLGTP